MTAPTWRDDALCAQIGGEEWFPSSGDTSAAARRICARCEVRTDCLAFALAHGEDEGIWGGLNPRERRALKTTSGRRYGPRYERGAA